MIHFAKSTMLALACAFVFASCSHASEYPDSRNQEVAVDQSEPTDDLTEFLECSLDMAVLQGNVRAMVIRTMIELNQELLFGNSGSPKGLSGRPSGSGRFHLESSRFLVNDIKGLAGVPAGSSRFHLESSRFLVNVIKGVAGMTTGSER